MKQKGFTLKMKAPGLVSKIKAAGFTLIELLLVVVLISVLSGVVLSVINITGIRARTRDAQRVGDLKRLQTALELYFADYRGYPANSLGFTLINTASPTILKTKLAGVYMQTLPQDPRSGETMTATCAKSAYGYYYKTNTCVGVGCNAAKYVLMTFVESAAAAANSACNSLANCSTIAGCSCPAPLYGVENPL